MHMPKSGRIALALAASLLLISCSGSSGSTGPAGATGATGPTGPAGSANVIYSAWKPALANWNVLTKDGSQNKSSFIEAPEITQSALDSALIMVYAKFSSNDLVLALPYTSFAGGTANTLWFQGQIEATEPVAYLTVPGGVSVSAGAAVPTAQQNRIRLYRFTHDNSGTIGVSSAGTYRYIIIPGGVAAAPMAPGQHGTMVPLDLTDYEQVKRHYNLPD